mgnify:CR=1 FL=1
MDKKKKILYTVIALIIVVGILITCIWGFNVNISYTEHKQVDIYIGKEFNSEDINKIAKEVLGKQEIRVQKVEVYEDMVSINAKEITNEQLEQINQKINEKYELENKADSLTITSVPKIRLLDEIKPYIIPAIISAVIIIVYSVIRYRKIGVLKLLISLVKSLVLPQAIYFSILAITRLPICRLTMPVALVILVVTLFVEYNNLEKAKDKKDLETKKKSKK